jgi:hypothetical protein
MPSLSYERVCDAFFGCITDYKLAAQRESLTTAYTSEWHRKAVYTPYIKKLFTSVSLDDSIQVMTYEMTRSEDEESDAEFLIGILSKQMVHEWLAPIKNDIALLAQFFGGREQKFYSQAAHLAEVRAADEDAFLEARRMIRDRGAYLNDYLSGTGGGRK